MWVGGAGGNAVNNMIEKQLDGVDFVVANTDAQALQQSKSENKVQLGVKVTEGLGAGARPTVGASAAEETLEEISEDLDEAREETSGSKFADRVKNTVLDKVENMLNKQLNYPTENIERITWEDGRMIFTMEDGGEAWDGIWVGDDSVLESFSEDDAIEFIQEFETVKAAGQ